MPSTGLQILAEILRWAPVALAVISGLVAIRWLRREPLRSRSDRRIGIGLAALPAGVCGLYVELIGAAFAAFDTVVQPRHYLFVAPLAGATFAVVFLGGLAGYAIAARRWRSGVASLGAIAGAVLVIALFFGANVASVAVHNASYDLAVQEHEDEVTSRSSGITLRTDVQGVETADNGTISLIHLVALVTSDADVTFDLSSKIVYPRFWFQLEGGGRVDVEAGFGDPKGLTKGEEATFDLRFLIPDDVVHATSGTSRVPPPGTWTLHMDVLDADGKEYTVETPVDIYPG